jgi:hypothetical protein
LGQNSDDSYLEMDDWFFVFYSFHS